MEDSKKPLILLIVALILGLIAFYFNMAIYYSLYPVEMLRNLSTAIAIMEIVMVAMIGLVIYLLKPCIATALIGISIVIMYPMILIIEYYNGWFWSIHPFRALYSLLLILGSFALGLIAIWIRNHKDDLLDFKLMGIEKIE